MNIPYTITNDSISVVLDGKPFVVKRGSPNFDKLLVTLVNGDWDKVSEFVTVAKLVSDWSDGDFKLADGKVTHKGKDLPPRLHNRLLGLITKGESATSLLRFWERLKANPSMRSVKMLFEFLDHGGIPITEDGYFLAYKGVNGDFTDCHTGKIDNRPGAKPPRIPRNEVSDDPRTACHYGYHVGALAYAGSFGKRTVICKVDPADVVCVPYDSSQHKMRITFYEVIGNHGARLDSTSITDAEIEVVVEEPPPVPTPPTSDLAGAVSVAQNGEASVVPDDKTGAVSVEDPYARLATLDSIDLMKESLDTLRKYGAHGLKIVGASKIPGGKFALVTRIVEVRGDE